MSFNLKHLFKTPTFSNKNVNSNYLNKITKVGRYKKKPVSVV